MAYSTSLKVRFGDVDRASIVYYPTLFHYCHAAMEDFLEEELKFPLPELFDQLGTGIPIVHVEAEFKSPLVFGEMVHVRVAVEKIGQRSFVLGFTIIKPDDTICAQVSVTHVAVDLSTFLPRPIPAPLRERLEAS